MSEEHASAIWPTGEGELPDLVRNYDWRNTSLGPIGDWPKTLVTTVDIVLQSPVPMVLLWGQEGVMIYNDAYSVFAGGDGTHNSSGPRCCTGGLR